MFVRWIHLLNVTGLRIAHCFPAGKTIVPPFPHDCMAEMMAGESSVPAFPAEAGVQVARLASIVGVESWSSGDAVIQTDVVTRSSTQEKGRHIAEEALRVDLTSYTLIHAVHATGCGHSKNQRGPAPPVQPCNFPYAMN